MESGSNDKKGYEIVLAVLGLLFIAVITGLPLLHLIRVRKNFQNIIKYENGILQDFSGILNHKKTVPIKNIESAYIVNRITAIGNFNQLIIKSRNANKTGNSLFDQLKGRVIYITDYLVDKKEFEKLAYIIQNNIT